jgi:hypothetical protein
LIQCKNEQNALKLLKPKHNTPSLTAKNALKMPMLRPEDLIGYEYSEEMLLETNGTQIESENLKNMISQYMRQYKSNYNAMPFEKKYLALKSNLANTKIDWRLGYSDLELVRDDILNQSIEQFQKIDPFKELKICFLGEVSHDAGGLIREWFTIMFKELLSENLGIFEKADCEEFLYKIKKGLTPSEDNLKYFRFIGQMLAKAMLENISIHTCFNLLIFKMILNEKITLDDLEFYDQNVIIKIV